jgi:outer membrane receptor protein involved in Fe transport
LSTLYVVGTSLFIKASWSYGSYRSSALDPIANGFLDAAIRYKPLKSKHSVELNVNNIFDKKSFTSYSLSPNLENRQVIPLRGCQSVLKYSFLF